MDTAPAFGFSELFNFVIGNIARALSERDGESAEQQLLRTQATVHTILSLLPRDVVEAYLAGHCVMMHEMMLAGVRETLQAAADPVRRGPRGNVAALNKAFNDNLDLLQRHQARPAAGQREAAARAPEAAFATATPQDAPAEPAVTPAGPAAAPATTIAATEVNAADQAARETGTAFTYHPSPAALAECRANPAAMAALEAGDPGRFATAMGITGGLHVVAGDGGGKSARGS